MATAWFYEEEGGTQGPLDERDFAALIASGKVQPHSLVWCSGMEDWMPLREVPDAPLPGKAPPPPPPPEPAPLRADLSAGLAEDLTGHVNPLRLRKRVSEDASESGSAPSASAGAAMIAAKYPEENRKKPNVSRAAAYEGKGGELFPLYLKNIVLTLLTLGIYKFWAQVEVRKYHYQHVLFRGGHLDYHATGRERLIGFLKGMTFLLLIAGLLYGLLFHVLDFSLDQIGTLIPPLMMGFLLLLRPLIIVGSMAFQLSRTSWNQMRFRFTGRVSNLYGIFLRDYLIMSVTFGIYYFWHEVQLMRFRRQHSTLGGVAFDYKGRGSELFAIHILGFLATSFTFGIYLPWYWAKLHRYHIDQTTFQGLRFRSSITGGQVLGNAIVIALMVIFSLGLAFPWAIVRWKNMLVNTVEAYGSLDLDQLRGEYDAQAGAFAEGIGEAGEALEALGQFFGG